jgi:hypothetical protein
VGGDGVDDKFVLAFQSNADVGDRKALPELDETASAKRSAAGGFLGKLMERLITHPMDARIAT